MSWSKKVLSIKTWLWNSNRFAQSVCFCIRFLSIWFTCTKGLQVMQTIWNAQQEQFLWRQTTMWNVNYTTSMKDIVRIVHLPPVVKSEFYEATRILFVCKEKKIWLYSSIRIRWTQTVVSDVTWIHFYVFLRFDLNENSVSMWWGWHRTAYAVCIQWIFTKMPLW